MNQRKASKKQIGFYAEPEENEALKKLASMHNTTVTGLLRAIARGELKILPAEKGGKKNPG